MANSKERGGDFMSKPDDGWAHNTAALAQGKGIYYSFPVNYVGSIQILTSITSLPMDTKIAICWEGIARTIEAAKIIKKVKRKFDKSLKKYIADSPYIGQRELKINMSVEGIATSELEGEGDIISNDSIGAISFAAGGQHALYDFVTYVAKDKRGNRYCHVFDCKILADDVLTTIGQIFNILQNKAADDIANDGQVLQQTFAQNLDKEEYKAAADIYGEIAEPAAGGQSSGAHINAAYEEGEDGDQEYSEVDAGQQFAQFLNDNVSSEPMYGEADDGDVDIYGDGTSPGWGYLDVKPDEDLYGGLADVFVDE